MLTNSTNPSGTLAPYPSRNIRLSSALWAMQFVPRADAEPATLVVDFETKQPVVTFWHEHTLPPDAPVAITFAAIDKMLTATHVGLWWEGCSGSRAGCDLKYSIEGYDDALLAMRRVHEKREWLIGAIKGKHRVAGDGRRQAKSVTTDSLHVASILLASNCPLIAFDRRTFVFSKKAAPIAALIHEAANPKDISKESRKAGKEVLKLKNSCVPAFLSDSPNPQRATMATFGKDLCIDWMLAALICRDRLKGFVDQCIAQIEKRDGDRVLRLSSQMPKTLRREFTRRF